MDDLFRDWLPLIGVILGAALSAITQLFAWRHERKNRQRQLFFDEKKKLYEQMAQSICALRLEVTVDNQEGTLSLQVGPQQREKLLKDYVESYQPKLLLYGGKAVISAFNALHRELKALRADDPQPAAAQFAACAQRVLDVMQNDLKRSA